jgi:hypothetical protein
MQESDATLHSRHCCRFRSLYERKLNIGGGITCDSPLDGISFECALLPPADFPPDASHRCSHAVTKCLTVPPRPHPQAAPSCHIVPSDSPFQDKSNRDSVKPRKKNRKNSLGETLKPIRNPFRLDDEDELDFSLRSFIFLCSPESLRALLSLQLIN